MPIKRIISLLGLSLLAVAGRAETFIIDSNHTLPIFEVNHLGFSTQRGRFNQTEGRIELDRKARTGHVTFKIATDSIDMGLAKWDEHMRSADFFDTAHFPQVTFESSVIRFEGDVPVNAEGTLKLLGISHPLDLQIQNFTCGENPIVKKSVCAANIETRLKRSDFGMTKYLPGISDEVHILVPVEAFRTDTINANPSPGTP